jgi:hypothetical protein
MPDIIIKLSEKGVQSVDAAVTAESQVKTLRFIERVFPAIQRLHAAARKQELGKVPSDR